MKDKTKSSDAKMIGAARHARARACAMLICACALAEPAFTLASAQAGAVQVTPSSWLQLRGGFSNAGALPGAFAANWKYKAPRPVRGLAVANGYVAIGTESADADAAPNQFSDDQTGVVALLDASTGQPLWTRTTPSWIHGDPAVYNGRIVVTFGRWPMTHPGGAMAFEERTGRVLWSLTEPAGMMPGPAIDSATNSAFMAGGDGVLLRVDISSGRILQQVGLGSADAMSSPRVDDRGHLFLAAATTVQSYATTDLRKLWSFHSTGLEDLGDVPVALQDSVVFCTGTSRVSPWTAARSLPLGKFFALAREAHQTKSISSYRTWFRQQWLLAIDRRTGELLWKRPLGIGLEVPRNTSGTPVVTAGRVLVSSPVSKTVWAFDAGSGRRVWSRTLASVHKGALTVTGDLVVAGEKSGSLELLAIDDGADIGACQSGGAFTPLAPVVVGRTILAATRNGWVFALPVDSLRARASHHAQRCL